MIRRFVAQGNYIARGFRTAKPSFSVQKLVEPSKRRLVGSWLLLTAFGVFSMVVVGGYTRLTHSGLSIVDWSPYTKKYPSKPEEWDVEFDKYKNSVEYKTVNNRMSVEQFKRIYTVEYVHRKIGVYLGYTFALPLAYFLYRGYLKPTMVRRTGALLLLGGLQGAIGYWMVRSGVDKQEAYQTRPRVSPYRLSVHLMMATTIYMGLLYHALKLLVVKSTPPTELGVKSVRGVRWLGIVLLKCLLLNIFTGALVAGIDAGKVYNTWPLMNGQLVPEEAKQVDSWKSFFENRALVQFNHRNMAYITQTVSLLLGYKLYKAWALLPPMVKMAGGLTFLLINYQAFSGIITLLNLVPPERANMHQMTAMITLSSAMLLTHACSLGLSSAALAAAI